MKIILLIAVLAIGGTSAARMRRLANGEPIPTEPASYLVAIVQKGWRICSGTLISSDRVLTTGRCAVDQNNVLHSGLKVVVVDDLRNMHSAGYAVSDVKLSRSVTGKLTRTMSIAVLILSESIPSYEKLAPIAMPTSDPMDTGRSNSPALLTASVIAITNDLHPFPDKPINRLDVSVTPCEFPNAFCEDDSDDLLTSGDEGAPLVLNRKLIGIVLDFSSDYDGRVIYANVYKYLKFIRQWLQPTDSPIYVNLRENKKNY